jgi:hypothetical protein
MFMPFVACAAGTRMSEQRRRSVRIEAADVWPWFIENPPFVLLQCTTVASFYQQVNEYLIYATDAAQALKL